MNNNSIFKDHNLTSPEKDVGSIILSLLLSGVARCKKIRWVKLLSLCLL